MDEQFGGNIPPYAYLLLAFSLWMLVDAARRKAPSYWYFIILFLPFGAVFYFLFVKLRDFRPDAEQKSLDSNATSEAPSSPSTPTDDQPNLSQADTLEENERYTEAEPAYRRALALDASNKQALHGLARCRLGQGHAIDSLEYFERLLGLDREYRNYSVALDYAEALWEAGQKPDTIELLDQLAAHTNRINHRLALAHYLTEMGQLERARQEISSAIEVATNQPDAHSARTRQWITRGEQMLAALDQASRPTN